MAAPKRVYYCNECGAQFSQWMGQCTACQSWNGLIEAPAAKKSTASGSKLGYSGANNPQPIGIIEDTQTLRIATGIHELDQVLGDGLVKGSVILIGGDPGIGKSTLLLQTLANLSHQVKTLYVTGE